MVEESAEAARPALLFVPDISGFTQFVSGTALAHSRHIVEELLGTLIDANELGLELSEIEGDALLFYRFGAPPPAQALFAQVRRMFLAFHGQLRRYALQRICRCGACSGAERLTLKIVAHYGPVSLSRIKQHVKLFGTDVIVAHRLLKNEIPHHQYALFTRALADHWPAGTGPDWAALEAGAGDYDLGRIEYRHAPLEPLRTRVPEPRVEAFGIPGASVRAFSCEQLVHAPMDYVFEVVTDLDARMHWIDGAKRVEQPDPGLNRVGTRHRCVVDATSPLVVTSAVMHAPDAITFAETDEKKMGCAVFVFRREDDTATRVRVDFLARDALLPRLLLGLLFRRKLQAMFRRSLANLDRYCAARLAQERA